MISFSSNTLILTANRRLAAAIRQDYEEQQQAERQAIWETPVILPLRTWLQTLWRTHSLGVEHILTAAQEQQLWSQIIQETRQSQYPLLHLDNTVQLVQQAWQLFNDWQIPLAEVKRQAASAEAVLFAHWIEQWALHCQRHGWLSEAALPQQLQALLLKQPLPMPQPILIAGFDELPPAHRQLLQVIRRFTTVTEAPAPRSASERCHVEYPDLTTEIRQMAQWAKQHWTENSHRRIGCVVPQLTQHRATVVRIFKQVFALENQPFNISAGQSLSEFEIIKIGLQTLSLNEEKLPVETLGLLLQSPYLCQQEADADAGAQIDAECRRSHRYELTPAELFTAISRQQSQYPTQTWLARWRAFCAARRESAPLQPPSAWAAHFTEELTALGWPGGRSLNSLEYQIIARWQELLLELAELDIITPTMTRQTALHALRRLSAGTVFQPKTEPRTPIQILGAIESNGFTFDALWVMGLDDQNWPPSAQPNPFLPYALQIQRQMPHSSPQRELAYARQITQRLLNSAPKIWLSCSAGQPDQPARFSRLFEPVIPAQAGIYIETNAYASSSMDSRLRGNDTYTRDETYTRNETYAEKIFASARKEIIDDHQGPAVAPPEPIRGGSGILTQQAECPFRAFARFRLNAAALEEPELGISAITRGILIHSTLERLWRVLKNQENLLAMPSHTLDNLLETTVEQVLQDILPQADSPFTHIEKNRLITIISEWMALEKQRPPFQVIAQETERVFELNGLRLTLKIDRIDQLSDGSHLLIDYKTGAVHSIQSWLSERLREPQLPLYALDYDRQNNFSGVAFAQLRIDKSGFKGLHTESLETSEYFPRGMVSVDAHNNFDAPRTWTALLAYWDAALQQLSADFHNGYAAVDPAAHGEPCETCDLQALCRIQP